MKEHPVPLQHQVALDEPTTVLRQACMTDPGGAWACIAIPALTASQHRTTVLAHGPLRELNSTIDAIAGLEESQSLLFCRDVVHLFVPVVSVVSVGALYYNHP